MPMIFKVTLFIFFQSFYQYYPIESKFNLIFIIDPSAARAKIGFDGYYNLYLFIVGLMDYY